ncbi:hypothetical protein ICW40_15220 [Actinotalea ferrariae]|nr:hypothetical protein [Actinotalea ferrariae]
MELVDATAAAAQGGAPTGAEAVAPPVYGQWAADRHRVPAPEELPRWLRDLNADARHRVAAGLGAEVVRANQEEYVDAAWAQVGDVLAANGLLDLARMMSIVVTRVHTKHVVGIDPLRALDLVAPALRRVLLGGATVHDLVRRSAMPGGFGTRDFRRLVSPRSAPLRLAARRAGLPLTRSGGVDLAPLGRAALGALAPDLRMVPDGLRGSRLPELVDTGRIALPPHERQLVEQLSGLVREHAGRLVGVVTPEIRVRPDLGRSGVLVDRHLRAVRQGAGRHADLASGLASIRAAAAAPVGPLGGHLVGFVLAQGGVAPVSLAADGATLSARLHDTTATVTVSAPQLEVPGPLLRPSVPPAVVAGPLVDAVMRERIRLSADLLPGTVRPGRTGTDAVRPLPQPEAAAHVGPGVATGSLLPVEALQVEALPIEALATDLGVTGQVVTVDAPLLVAAAVGAFAQSFTAARAASVVKTVPAPQPSPPLDITTLRDHLVEATRPTAMALRRAQARVTVQGRGLPGTGAGGVGDVTWAQLHPMSPIMVGPVLDRPLYLDLARFDQERFLPGAGQIPDDAITLLETNPRFVESFLVGANHELNRELLWRRYPTDRRGTPLRAFWDRGPGGRDIEPVHTWSPSGRLGSHGAGDADGALVLLVRGQLLRRYPHTVVYAAPATPDRRIDPAAAPVLPVFAGHLDPDIVFVGFALSAADATAGDGTMFVLQEQPTEPRFGLDVPRGDEQTGAPPTTWSDLTWGHVGVAPGGHFSVAAIDGSAARPLTEGSPTSVQFGKDAAHVAALTFQRPFRAAVHSSEVLD